MRKDKFHDIKSKLNNDNFQKDIQGVLEKYNLGNLTLRGIRLEEPPEELTCDSGYKPGWVQAGNTFVLRCVKIRP